MDCPDEKIMQDLVDCELSTELQEQTLAHIKSCSQCRFRLKQMMAFYGILGEAVGKESCPTKEELEHFAIGKLSTQNSDRVKEHIERCPSCESYVQLFQASDEQLAEHAVREKVLFQKAAVQERAYDVAKVIIKKLLPDRICVFESLWEQICGALEEMLETKTLRGLSFGGSGEFVGALGFSGVPDTQTVAATIIISTTFATAYTLSDKNSNSDSATIKQTVSDIAERFGAGKELRKRLTETIPPHFTDT